MARRKKLELSITCSEKGEVTRSLALHANNMNDLIEKIIEWTDWEAELPYLEKIAEQKNPGFLKSEKRSGWYYIKNKKKRKK